MQSLLQDKAFIKLLLLLVSMLLPGVYLNAYAGTKGLIYPDVSGPLNLIITEIIKGVEDSASGDLIKVSVAKGYSESKVESKLKGASSDVVLALGSRSFEAVNQIGSSKKVIVGAVLQPPEGKNDNIIVISYIPDPNEVLQHLKSLSSEVKNVHIVYDPSKNQWVVNAAINAAKKLGLKLVSHKSSSLKESVKHYDKIFETASENDSVWLLQDKFSVDSKVILPMLLQHAWDKKVPVFSNNLSHVDKGVLFSFFPDNYMLGKELGKIMNKVESGNYSGEKLQQLKQLKRAVNVRTASHLGLHVNKRKQEQYDLVFPKSGRR